jgi:KDO2-lipid IV(A) lauroyltransferase
VFNFLLYRFGQFLAVNLPLRFGYWLAVFFSDFRSLFASQDRILVTENLKVIFPEKTEQEISCIQKKMSRNFAKYLVDFFRFEKLNKEFVNKYIRIEGLSFIDEALARGKGVIAVTAHIGNWELGGAAVALLGYKFLAVALPHANKRVDDFFNSSRQGKGVKVVPLGKAVRTCIKDLKSNMILALVGDRDFTEKGIVTDFFGKKAVFPEGPAAFALKTGASVVPGFVLRNPDDTFTIRFEKPLEHKPCGNKDKDTRQIISSYVQIFERYIRAYPEQWYMFRRFWIE